MEEYACGNCILRQESKADEEVSDVDIAHGAAEIKAKIGKIGGNVEVYVDVELDKKMEEDEDESCIWLLRRSVLLAPGKHDEKAW